MHLSLLCRKLGAPVLFVRRDSRFRFLGVGQRASPKAFFVTYCCLVFGVWCVGVCVRVRACGCVCARACAGACVRVHVCLCACVRVLRACLRARVRACARVHACVCACDRRGVGVGVGVASERTAEAKFLHLHWACGLRALGFKEGIITLLTKSHVPLSRVWGWRVQENPCDLLDEHVVRLQHKHFWLRIGCQEAALRVQGLGLRV